MNRIAHLLEPIQDPHVRHTIRSTDSFRLYRTAERKIAAAKAGHEPSDETHQFNQELTIELDIRQEMEDEFDMLRRDTTLFIEEDKDVDGLSPGDF